ncbi:unnamed protein product [Heterobilharzia americana]|nr:unnamed protein product [Heterobilharzia americana]
MPGTVCLFLPLVDRLKELSSFFAKGNIQDIQSLVIPVVDNIFGYSDGVEGWGLHSLKEPDNPHLFGCIREFLSPNGRFLEVLSSKLTLEFPLCKYDFPLWLLSATSQNAVRSGDGKHPQTHLSLNAFSYYMYAFMCYTTYPKWKQNILLFDFENSLYFALYNDYLSFYLYTDPMTVNVMASRLQLSRTGLQVPAYQRNYFGESVIQFPSESIEGCFSEFRLFWQTESILQAICEFLLSWRVPELPKSIVGSPNNPTGMVSLSAPQSHVELSTKPTVCQVFLVRSFLKHFYFSLFNNTSPSNFQIPDQQMIWSKFLSYRRYLCSNQGVITSQESSIPHHNIMNQFLQYMIYCFQHWPLDLSFEVVLETWLSSVQPWRYAQSLQPQANSRCSPLAHRDGLMNSQMNIDNDCYPEWVTFVARHYSLYVALFLLFIQRAIRTDLCVCRNAHMVYRVAKVFSQDGFKTLLMNTEKLLCEQQQHQQQDDAQSPTLMHNLMALDHQSKQTGLWNPVVIKAVERIVNSMMTTRTNLQSEMIRKANRSSSDSTGLFNQVTEWLYSLLMLEGNNTDDNVNKCISYLTEGIHALCEFFNIPETLEVEINMSPKLSQPGRIHWDDLGNSSLVMRPHLQSPSTLSPSSSTLYGKYSNLMNSLSDEYHPSWSTSTYSIPQNKAVINHHNNDNNNNDDNRNSLEPEKVLTPFDRFRIIMGMQRPNVFRQTTNRDYVSTYSTSYENRFILAACNYIEDKINGKMKNYFIHWCKLRDIRGRIARRILLRTSTVNQSKSQLSQKSSSNHPRLSFRFLANYYILIRLFLLYLFSYACLGIHSPVFYIFCLIILCIFYQIFQSLLGMCYEKIKQL